MTCHDLPTAEAALLWAMRVWVIGHCRKVDVTTRLEGGLAALGAERSLGYLEGFMWALSRGATRPIAVDCVCHPEVSDDERLLLRAFALLQEDARDDAVALYRELVTARAADVACDSAERLVDGFLAAGLELAWRSAHGGRYRIAGTPATIH